ncbi:hypothetical protein ADL28_16035 [Streptomyces violaceusniger]|uniref:Uncharacterized protein n=1 Tax=Streptomyces violaceusniger TaxID=68280 RepID=A0A0X3WWI0_STRVO|nr:hypothetical protein ADL28_16035 [Streptomyces violaceusniger]
MVSHAGSRLLADFADATGLAGTFTDALRRLRPRGTGYDPGRIAVDLAVMLADGGEAIADLALLRDQHEVFGPVASTPTAWRLLADIDTSTLAALRAARAAARAPRPQTQAHPRRHRPGPSDVRGQGRRRQAAAYCRRDRRRVIPHLQSLAGPLAAGAEADER